MRIGLLTSSLSRNGGGVFESVVAQAHVVAELGHEPVIFGVADEHTAVDSQRFAPFKTHAVKGVGPRSLAYAPRLFGALVEHDIAVLHQHGVWTPTSIGARRWAEKTQRPYLISAHGMLDPWIVARGRLKKRIATFAYERRSWSAAHAFHALTNEEARDIAQMTGKHAFVIPNCVEGDAQPKRRFDGTNYLYLSRIHPKKNVELLVDGWARARAAGALAGSTLSLYGWGEADHVASLIELVARTGDPAITFNGAVSGDAKTALLADARYVVLPSQSEGLPMTILEAWSNGTPTIMTDACHLNGGFAAGAAIRCEGTVESIASALIEGERVSRDDYAAMCAAATSLVREQFSRATVTARWGDLLADLTTGSSRPSA